MSGLNPVAAAVDPRPFSRTGFAGIWFRRVAVEPSTGQAPDWAPARDLVKKRVPGGNVTKYQDIGRSPDTLSLSCEVDTVADGVALRALIGTVGDLTLPGTRYDSSDYGVGVFYPQNDAVFRTQSALLASATSQITTRGTVKFDLTFERDPN